MTSPRAPSGALAKVPAAVGPAAVASDPPPRGALPPVVAVVGPTACGKSELGIALALRFGGEVVSADSRQVYRGMDIGTGKVAGRARPDRATRLGDFDMVPLESDGVLHWMLDIAAPGDPFTAASYKAAALAVMAELAARGRLPVVVGGTGLYVRALTEGLEIPAVPPDEALRAELERVALPGLVERLRRLDPDAGEVVDVRNPRRLIRAIEILTHLGGSMAQWRRRKAPPFRFLVLGLCPGSEEVRRRIHERLERRLSEGMVAEVRGLLDGGVPVKTLDDFGLEYRFVTRHLQGRFSLEEMTRQLDAAIVRYAKRQMTWFRKYSSVVWLAGPSEAAPLVEAFLEAP